MVWGYGEIGCLGVRRLGRETSILTVGEGGV